MHSFNEAQIKTRTIFEILSTPFHERAIQMGCHNVYFNSELYKKNVKDNLHQIYFYYLDAKIEMHHYVIFI